MVLSFYIVKPLYCAAWHIVRLFRRKNIAVLYCDDAFDVTLFKNVKKHLSTVAIVAKNSRVARAIRANGYACRVMPVFPDVVIMFRNMAWKFPCKKIVKFGFEHGAYNFKRFSKAAYYNMFDCFFMTSSHDVGRVKKIGVTTAMPVGFPKIDGALDGSITGSELDRVASLCGIDKRKKTLLFSATWDGSGMSAVQLWSKKFGELASRYNVLVTLHPWTSVSYKRDVAATPGVYLVEEYDLTRYIMLADICISDTTSLIAEFCLLDKPIITFRIPATPRTMEDIVELLDNVSVRIDRYEELEPAIIALLKGDHKHSEMRKSAVEIFFDKPDGNAGMRAAAAIVHKVPWLVIRTP